MNKIKTWQERAEADGYYGQPPLSDAFFYAKEEITELRAALATSSAPDAGKVAPATVEAGKDSDRIAEILTEQKKAVKLKYGDWWRGYEAALHWVTKAITEESK